MKILLFNMRKIDLESMRCFLLLNNSKGIFFLLKRTCLHFPNYNHFLSLKQKHCINFFSIFKITSLFNSDFPTERIKHKATNTLNVFIIFAVRLKSILNITKQRQNNFNCRKETVLNVAHLWQEKCKCR